MNKYFMDDNTKRKEWYEKDFLINTKEIVKEYQEALILPAKKIIENKYDGIYAGGVCDNNFNFIAGLNRNNEMSNYSCYTSYIPDEDIIYQDEEVIFGGTIIPHFGHFIIEGLSRLWYEIENPSNKKIAFTKYGKVDNYVYDILSLLNINKKRILIIDKPTKFKNVIVPSETTNALIGYTKKYKMIYDYIKNQVEINNDKKVYLSRSNLKDKNDINESFFENFYEKRGFKIIHLEELPINKQISIMKSAKEIVCPCGTLSHMILFSNDNIKITILNRNSNDIVKPQGIINHLRNADATFIDASLDVLPTRHAFGCTLFYPTKYFINYLNENNIKYTKKELEVNKKDLVYDYLKAWVNNYKNTFNYKSIEEFDSYDYIKTLNKCFNEDILKRKDYDNKKIHIQSKNSIRKELEEEIENEKELKKEIKILKDEIKNIKKEKEKLSKRVTTIENSRSWKATKPLRYVTNKLKLK